MKFSSLILPKIHNMIVRGDHGALRSCCASLHPADLAPALADAAAADVLTVLEGLDPEESAGVLAHLEAEKQVEIAALIPNERLARIISRMDADDRVDLTQLLLEEHSEKVLHLLARAEREDICTLGSYHEGTASTAIISPQILLTNHLIFWGQKRI